MKLNPLKPIAIAFSILLFVSLTPVHAEEDTSNTGGPENSVENKDRQMEDLQNRTDDKLQKLEERKDAMEQKKAEFEQNKEDLVAKKCEIVQKRVDLIIDRYTNNNGKYRELFSKLVEKLQALTDRAKNEGLDVSKLEDDIEALKVKIDDASTNYENYIHDLTDTKSLICGQSEGQYKEEIVQALKAHRELKRQFLDVRTFYQTVIRPDLKDLRDQLKQKAEEQKNENESSESNENNED